MSEEEACVDDAPGLIQAAEELLGTLIGIKDRLKEAGQPTAEIEERIWKARTKLRAARKVLKE